MHLVRWIAATALAGVWIGEAPAQAAPPAPQKAVCSVCGPRDGEGPETVTFVVEHDGKGYPVCSESCRDEFAKDPQRWIGLAASQAAPPRREGGSAVPS